jgi:type II secretory pathway component GspD/PulD (secretin)
LSLSRDEPVPVSNTANGVGSRTMTTKVLVDSGATLVIGGIYTSSSSHTSNGFPILRKIPIFGKLFGNDTDNTSRSELFFFVTPRILNSKEAGLTTGTAS